MASTVPISKKHHCIPVQYQKQFQDPTIENKTQTYTLKEKNQKKYPNSNIFETGFNSLFLKNELFSINLIGLQKDIIEKIVWNIDGISLQTRKKITSLDGDIQSKISKTEKDEIITFLISLIMRREWYLKTIETKYLDQMLPNFKKIAKFLQIDIQHFNSMINWWKEKSIVSRIYLTSLIGVYSNQSIWSRHFHIISTNKDILCGWTMWFSIKNGILDLATMNGLDSDILIFPLSRNKILILSKEKLTQKILSYFTENKFCHFINILILYYSKNDKKETEISGSHSELTIMQNLFIDKETRKIKHNLSYWKFKLQSHFKNKLFTHFNATNKESLSIPYLKEVLDLKKNIENATKNDLEKMIRSTYLNYSQNDRFIFFTRLANNHKISTDMFKKIIISDPSDNQIKIMMTPPNQLKSLTIYYLYQKYPSYI